VSFLVFCPAHSTVPLSFDTATGRPYCAVCVEEVCENPPAVSPLRPVEEASEQHDEPPILDTKGTSVFTKKWGLVELQANRSVTHTPKEAKNQAKKRRRKEKEEANQ
jgi:hypothetical protein